MNILSHATGPVEAFKKYASGDEGDDELIREVQTDDIPKFRTGGSFPIFRVDVWMGKTPEKFQRQGSGMVDTIT